MNSSHMPLYKNVSTCNWKCQPEIYFQANLQTQSFIMLRTKYFKEPETEVITSRQ